MEKLLKNKILEDLYNERGEQYENYYAKMYDESKAKKEKDQMEEKLIEKIKSIVILLIFVYNIFKQECRVWLSRYPTERRTRHTGLEQVYIFIIYMLIFELAHVLVVAVTLFVVLVATIRKLDSKKHISALNELEMYLI